MKIIDIINEEIIKAKVWYHGSPDVRGLKQTGSFSPKTNTTDYIGDPAKWQQVQNQMQDARNAGNEDLYFQLLDQAGKLRKNLTYNKPIYFTDNRGVAKTYSDPKRAFDYQNSEPALLQATIDDTGNVLRVPAHGETFRGIKADIVRRALVSAGIPDEEIDKQFAMFPTDIRGGKMTAETLGVIAQQLGFDIVDVLGVLDSYEGGSIQSNVRMVFDPNRIKIIG